MITGLPPHPQQEPPPRPVRRGFLILASEVQAALVELDRHRGPTAAAISPHRALTSVFGGPQL